MKLNIMLLVMSLFMAIVPQSGQSASPGNGNVTPTASSAHSKIPTRTSTLKGKIPGCIPMNVKWSLKTGKPHCCPGLTPTSQYHRDHPTLRCDSIPPEGNSGYCVKCGDGRCDKIHFESDCNCPKDCS